MGYYLNVQFQCQRVNVSSVCLSTGAVHDNDNVRLCLTGIKKKICKGHKNLNRPAFSPGVFFNSIIHTVYILTTNTSINKCT